MSKIMTISTIAASFPLEEGQPSVVPSPHSLHLRRRDATVRAAALVCASFMNVGWAQDARATFGLSGPKDWLQGQKRRTAPSLFRPILSARAKLQRSLELIGEQNGVSPEAADLIRFSLLDCTPPPPGSLVDLQSRTGIMVCTYALLLKNAASLLEDDDDRKVGGQDALRQLNRQAAGGCRNTTGSLMCELRSFYTSLPPRLRVGVRLGWGVDLLRSWKMQWTTLQLPGTARLCWQRRKPSVRAVCAMCAMCRGSAVERKVRATLAALDTFQRSLETILGMA